MTPKDMVNGKKSKDRETGEKTNSRCMRRCEGHDTGAHDL